MTATCPQCGEPAIARIADGRPLSLYAIVRPLRPGDSRGCPACLHHAHLAIDQLLMAARETKRAVCKSQEWGLCNGIGCPICSPVGDA